MEKILSFKGKLDREKIASTNKHLQIEREKIYYAPRTQLEEVIQASFRDTKDSLKTKGHLEVEEAITTYQNARNWRHDIWVEVLQMSSTNAAHKFGDILVSDFVKTNFPNIDFKLDARPMFKTPDILCFDESSRSVILGDVAVAKSYNLSNRRKYIKYLEIETMLKAKDIKVVRNNLIINEDLSNVSTQIRELTDLGIINVPYTLMQRAIQYHKTCETIMKDSVEGCCDKKMFAIRLDQIDKIDTSFNEVSIPEPLTVNASFERTQPEMAEAEIIKMIKDKVSTMDEPNEFFDESIEQSKVSFEKIIEKNKSHEHMEPKSCIKVVSNQQGYEKHTNYELMRDYCYDLLTGDDDDVKEYMISLLPSVKQTGAMESIYKDKDGKRKATDNEKRCRVYGPSQYSRTRTVNDNKIVANLNNQLRKGLKERNQKRAPRTINPDSYEDCKDYIDRMISHLGSLSGKPDFLDNSWDAKTEQEAECSKGEEEIYKYVKKTNAAQLCQSLSNMYHRITHTKTKLSMKDNIYIPPNGSFIAIIPKEHAPFSSRVCDLPLIFMTRIDINDPNKDEILKTNEFEHVFYTDKYVYLTSKLCRLNADKIAHWDQLGYRYIACTSYILSRCPDLQSDKQRVCGILSLLMIDGHQKVSEYLDLLKYIAFMPFSDVSRLSKLVEDKLDLLIKTRMDVWLFENIQGFMYSLADIDALNAIKPKLHLHNSNVTKESLGLSMTIPSFMINRVRHRSIDNFIEEVNMIYIVRPKQLYGSQFMDKAITNIAVWNQEFDDEVKEHGQWAIDGTGNTPYPFDAKFTFCRDAIIHAQDYFHDNFAPTMNKVMRKIGSTKLTGFMHNNCSLRGCVKHPSLRKNNTDIHSTSCDEVLKYYKRVNYDNEKCTAIGVANDFIQSGYPMEFSMSEKNQRGGGRPIATPTLGTKAALMMIEKPEQAVGQLLDNNIVVEGKNKLQEQCEAYKELLSTGAINGLKQVYQLTEDQQKFSENDNTRKYEVYISNNRCLPPNIKAMQMTCLKKLTERHHLVKRLPRHISDNYSLTKETLPWKNGVYGRIGWPQGMLNFISTNMHSIADYWITYAYNKAYPESKVITRGLVHSDDSWVAVACNSMQDFKNFVKFRTMAKRLFCLKLNEKKVWGSRLLGELVSNYNINGNVHLSVSKTLANSFGNLLFQNWVIDVNNQISSLQQAYRSGANIATLILMSTILRQQMISSYQVNGKQLSMIHDLPIELGGYPSCSAFELGITGLSSHYKKILTNAQRDPTAEPSLITLKTLRLSTIYNKADGTGEYEVNLAVETHKSKKYCITDEGSNDIDYQSVAVPNRGDVFSCIKHIMPKSRKVSQTIKSISELPFESDGLEMIITNPKELGVALGHMKSQTSTMLFQLAADKYTQNAKRLAISQAIQSSGKVVRVGGSNPMTMNEMLDFFLTLDIQPSLPDSLEVALNDETDVAAFCEAVVYKSECVPSGIDKRRVINRMPNIEGKFNTITDIKTVLLYLIDERKGTNYLQEYGSKDTPASVIKADSEVIRKKFYIYFKYYTIEYACNLIMQQYLSRSRSRLWMQPHLNNESLENFICDLYGKTLNMDYNFRVNITTYGKIENRDDHNIVNTIYTTDVLNEMYKGKFIISQFSGLNIREVIRNIDHTKLNPDDFLKFAIIYYNHMDGNTDFLKTFDKMKMYDQYYVKPQIYDERLKMFVGKFICMVKFGHTVLKIEGEPEDIVITGNGSNVDEILMAMFLFVEKNFRSYRYYTPGKWGESPFWKTKFHLSRLSLTQYNIMTTSITTSRTPYSLSYIINKNIRMPDVFKEDIGEDYRVTDNCRIVIKTVRGEDVKVATVNQTMQAPLAKNIQLVDDLINGLNNNQLLQSKVIINLTLKRYNNCNKSDLRALVDNCLPGLSNKLLVMFYANLEDNFANLNILPPTRQHGEQEEVITTYQISGLSSLNFIEDHQLTVPEDLTYVEAEFGYSDEVRIGSLHTHRDVLRLICSILCSNISMDDVSMLIECLIDDPAIMKLLVEDIDSENLEETTDIRMQAADLSPDIDMTVRSFIYGMVLDDPETWKKINMMAILNRQGQKVYSMQILRLAHLFKDSIFKVIYEEDDPSINYKLTLLRRLMERKGK